MVNPMTVMLCTTTVMFCGLTATDWKDFHWRFSVYLWLVLACLNVPVQLSNVLGHMKIFLRFLWVVCMFNHIFQSWITSVFANGNDKFKQQNLFSQWGTTLSWIECSICFAKGKPVVPKKGQNSSKNVWQKLQLKKITTVLWNDSYDNRLVNSMTVTTVWYWLSFFFSFKFNFFFVLPMDTK